MTAWVDRLEGDAERPNGHAAPPPPKATGGSAYGRAALEREAEELRNTAKGGRNARLNAAAFALARLVAGGELDEREARETLTAAARACGLGEREIGATLESGFSSGLEQPRSAPPREKHRTTAGDRTDEPEGESPDDTETAKPKAPPKRRGLSVSDVIGGWGAEGPLVHEPTGIKKLDELTGGGPVYGTRWIINGAPDAGKTLLLMHIADAFALRGVHVGILAVDEEAGDLVTRFAQRRGYMRVDCEVRESSTLADIAETLGTLPLRFYDDSFTIETAAADLTSGLPTGARVAFLCDSIQTVKSNAVVAGSVSGREMSEVAAVTANVRALRTMASKHRMIAIATSEFGRGAYRESDPAKQTTTMASGKWSSAIEYSARVLIGLRSMPDVPDLVDLELAKNKHGPRDEHVFLRIDRRSQTLVETNFAPEPEQTAGDRDAAVVSRVAADAVVVARVLEAEPGTIARSLRSAVRARSGIGHERTDAAIAYLGRAVVRGPVGAHGAIPLSLDRTLLPDDVRRALDAGQ